MPAAVERFCGNNLLIDRYAGSFAWIINQIVISDITLVTLASWGSFRRNVDLPHIFRDCVGFKVSFHKSLTVPWLLYRNR